MELFTQIELNNLEPASSDNTLSTEALNAIEKCEVVDLFCGVGGLTHGFIKESFKVKLANGVEIDALKAGIEDKLVAFLGTNYKALGADSLKKIWFDFDNLNFKTGSAELTAESQKQVDNMTAILKAYPAVKLKIGGYTDKVGDEAKNKKLSGDRAAAVKDALAKAGVGAQVTDAEGYGSAMAKYAADAPEADRVKDRHVSVSLRL